MPRCVAPLESESRQIDLRFLAQLHERQAEVGVQVKAAFSYFVEDGHATEVVAALEERTHQAAASSASGPTGSPSATQVRPSTPYMMKRGPAVVEEDAPCREDRRGTETSPTAPRSPAPRHRDRPQLAAAPRAARGRQPGERKQQQGQGRADRSTQEPRRLASQLELPPELVRVLHVLEREEPQPHRGAEGTGQRRDPRAQRIACRRRRPGDRTPAAPARARVSTRRRRVGFLVIEALQERRGHAE